VLATLIALVRLAAPIALIALITLITLATLVALVALVRRAWGEAGAGVRDCSQPKPAARQAVGPAYSRWLPLELGPMPEPGCGRRWQDWMVW
jgi:hypothetical protein